MGQESDSVKGSLVPVTRAQALLLHLHAFPTVHSKPRCLAWLGGEAERAEASASNSPAHGLGSARIYTGLKPSLFIVRLGELVGPACTGLLGAEFESVLLG